MIDEADIDILQAQIDNTPDRLKVQLDWPECETVKKLIAEHEAARGMERSAFLWDTFVSNGRIRTLGWAKLGEPGYQHMGFEIWTIHGYKDKEKEIAEETAKSIANLEKYLDAWAKSSPPLPTGESDG